MSTFFKQQFEMIFLQFSLNFMFRNFLFNFLYFYLNFWLVRLKLSVENCLSSQILPLVFPTFFNSLDG